MSFERPDVWHAPATYWFWHRIPTAEEISTQLDQLAGAGFRSFQIQARLSFPLDEYLGEEYLAACRAAADEAAARGLMMGVYDEYNWLSGHAGGRTVAGRDELRESHLFWSAAQSTSQGSGDDVECVVGDIRPTDVEYLLDPGMAWVFEDGKVRWADWLVVAALAHPAGGIGSAESIVDVTAAAELVTSGDGGCTVRVPRDVLPSGLDAVTVFVAARCASSRMINYLLPEAAERFLEVGYQPYADAFGEHFGTTVQYMFFDQPHGCFFRWREHTGHVGSSLMFAPGIVPADRRELLALVTDVGPMTPAWRCAFFERYSSTGIDAFFQPLSRWCGEHSVALSGHEVLGYVSSWDPASTIITEDPRTNFGTDYFGLDRWRDLTAVDARNAHPQIGAKFGDSVARSNGRSGCLVEQYFARTVTGSHFAAGRWELTLSELRAQTVRHHLLGARQLLMHAFWLTDGDDRDELFTNPRFDFAPGVNFEPWFGHHRAFAEESGRLSEFLDAADPLSEVAVLYPLRTNWAGGPSDGYGAHVAFWAEHLARTGYDYHLVDERDLRAGQLDGQYRVLVLPGVSVIADEDTVAALRSFVAGGGVVVASGRLPGATQAAGEDPALVERIRPLLASHWDGVPVAVDDADALDAVLGGALSGHVSVRAEPSVWSRRGRDGDGWRLAVFNDADQPARVTLSPSSLPGSLTRWRPESGLVDDVIELDGEYELSLGPGELACFQLGDGPSVVPATVSLRTGWTLTADGDPRPIAVDRGWEQQGLPRYSGVGEYRVSFDVTDEQLAWTRWELVLPAVHGSVEIDLNGESVARLGWGPYRCLLDDVLVKGRNELTLHVASTAANRYYAGTRHQADGLDPSGLAAAPVLRPFTRSRRAYRESR